MGVEGRMSAHIFWGLANEVQSEGIGKRQERSCAFGGGVGEAGDVVGRHRCVRGAGDVWGGEPASFGGDGGCEWGWEAGSFGGQRGGGERGGVAGQWQWRVWSREYVCGGDDAFLGGGGGIKKKREAGTGGSE